MNRLHRVIPALAAVGCVAVAPLASAVQFDITAASFTPGVGYGVDTGPNPENGGTLLDVRFASTFAPQLFSLAQVGDFFTFDLGSVSFVEPNTGNGGNLGIRNQELDGLDVTASFIFADPLGVTQDVVAAGVAYLGTISDGAVDYILDWNTLSASFGSGGAFDIDLADLSFGNTGSQTQTATITLRALPATLQAPAAVPEPAVLSLLGLGFLGMGLARLRKVA